MPLGLRQIAPCRERSQRVATDDRPMGQTAGNGVE